MVSDLPVGVWVILINQFLERFAFFGIKSTLELYLTTQLGYSEEQSTSIFHLFMFGSYFSVILGILVDQLLGKFKTILFFSMVSLIGHVLNTIGSTTTIMNSSKQSEYFTFGGLLLVALGVGGSKPSFLAFAGDQFILPQQAEQLHKFSSLFTIFNNLGILFSTIFIPILKDLKCMENVTCYPLGFGVSGIMMTLATLSFLAGKTFFRFDDKEECIGSLSKVFRIICFGVRNLFRTVSCRKWLDTAEAEHDPVLVEDVKQLFGTSGLLILFLPFIMFWALFDQLGSRWTLQASHMDGDLALFSLMPEQMLLLSPLLSLILIPTLDQIIYPLLAQVNILTSPLLRIASGGFLVALAFCMAGALQLQIDERQVQPVHMAWQVPQYLIISTGAVMVLISAFEFSYNQAPECFKSLIQAVWLLTISLGNLVTSIQSEIGGLSDSATALFLFSGLMVLSMVVFSWLAFRYTPRNMVTECQDGVYGHLGHTC